MVINHVVLGISENSEIILKSFGNETLLFHPASGDTLLLSPTAVPLIQCLRDGPVEKQKLFEKVAEKLDFDIDESFLSHMDEVLSGLIKRDIVAKQ